MLLAVIFLMFLLLLSLSIAAPKMARQIQRDHEVETMHRGKQYIRAIQLYYRKFHAYPPNVDALVNTNGIRFLRKRYIDPITGKDDWKPVLFGQNKAPTAMGFFGQPLAGSSIAGIGPSGGNGVPGLSGTSGSSLPGAGTSFTGGALGSIFNSGTTDSGNSQAGSSSGSSTTSSGGTDTGGGSTGTGTGSSAGGSGTTSSGTGTTGTGTTGTTGTAGTTTGQTFGGAGIIGFSPNSPKQSILIYKTKTKYDEWEFVYDPIIEQRTIQTGATGLGGQSSGTNSTFGNQSGTSFGNQSGSSFGTTGFGSSGSGSSGFGSSSGSGQGSGSGSTPSQ